MNFHEEFCPPRFRNYDDALLYMDCVQNRRIFPANKWIVPFIKLGDMIVINPEYRDAPFESTLITHPLAVDNLKA